MFSYKMEGLPGLLLRLMLTGLLVSANTFSPSAHGIPFFEKPNKPGKLEEEVKVQGESLSIKGFCSQQKKVWCKGDLLKECNPTESPSLSGPGWKYLTTEPNQRVVLQDLKNGCFSFLMSALQVEDSGIYLFGITDGLNIVPLRKIKVIVRKGLLAPNNTFSPPTPEVPFLKSSSKPGKRLEVVMKVQGESLSIEGFCSPQYLQQEGVWCKGDLLQECNPTEPSSLSGRGWQYLTSEPSQKFALQDLGNGCAAFFTTALQVEDSGIYWFGVLDGLNITPLRKIKVIVQKGQQNYGTVTETSENEQRYQHYIIFNLKATGLGICVCYSIYSSHRSILYCSWVQKNYVNRGNYRI
ncbi:uncharacterized protein LOC128416047 isoform X1 [Podarcis raffonei]|uniref:uncharacterized protein LOC128416047 isoform X1 n=1 Tax=Podarcis raffonei TaxID=65483 RepID=UPI0023295A43|nr:uncharacterized protein LOC128416047 isoform X1 [Podarcis raffonei]